MEFLSFVYNVYLDKLCVVVQTTNLNLLFVKGIN